MGHGKNFKGKHHHDTPPHKVTAPTVPTGQERALFANFAAMEYLKRHVGGQWAWDQKTHIFYADFSPNIAWAITEYFKPLGMTLQNDIINPGKTRITIQPAEYTRIEQIEALKREREPLAKQYQLLSSHKGKGR